MTQPTGPKPPTGPGAGPDPQSLIDWLRSLGPIQIKRLKLALGWDDANETIGAAFINAVITQYESLGAEGFASWTSETIPGATPWNPPPDMGKPPDPTIPKPDPEPDEEEPPTPEEIIGENAYETWVAWMKDNGIYSAETDALAKQLITEGRDTDWFKRALRETQTYKTAFPEWDMREQAGLLPISEGDILRLRSQYTALTQNYYGYTPNKQQLANLIGQGDKSIDEFEESLQIYKMVEEYGGATQQLFEAIYQVNLSDDDLMEIFRPGGNVALKKAFDYARYQGLPTLLGFNARSTEEADLLRNAGLTPDQAFQKFQKAGSLSPVMQKLGAIDANVTGNEFLNDVPLETLAKGLVFDFTEEGKAAMAEIQRTFAREFARFKKGGSAATDQSGRAVGLLAPGQR